MPKVSGGVEEYRALNRFATLLKAQASSNQKFGFEELLETPSAYK
jgi:hypothetical protein